MPLLVDVMLPEIAQLVGFSYIYVDELSCHAISINFRIAVLYDISSRELKATLVSLPD